MVEVQHWRVRQLVLDKLAVIKGAEVKWCLCCRIEEVELNIRRIYKCSQV